MKKTNALNIAQILFTW
ncbi:MAG: hypothetical protein EZS28_052852, partial [Streblomastix strix]